VTAIEPGRAKSTNDARHLLIARVIRNHYGGEALLVAQRQIDAAVGAVRDDWIAIADCLRP